MSEELKAPPPPPTSWCMRCEAYRVTEGAGTRVVGGESIDVCQWCIAEIDLQASGGKRALNLANEVCIVCGQPPQKRELSKKYGDDEPLCRRCVSARGMLKHDAVVAQKMMEHLTRTADVG